MKKLILVLALLLLTISGSFFYRTKFSNEVEKRAIETAPRYDEFKDGSTGLERNGNGITEKERQIPVVDSRAPGPDLIIEDIEIYKSPSALPEQGQRVVVKICNIGDIGFNSGDISGEPDKISISLTINGITSHSDKAIEIIGSGKCERAEASPFVYVDTYHAPWKGIQSGTHSVKAVVSTDVEESNRDNNSFTKNIYFNFDKLEDQIILTSPARGTAWRENGQYVMEWKAFGPKVARYYVVIGNYGSRTSKGETSSYSQNGIGNQTTLSFTIPNGFVESMFMGDSKGKVASDIKNDFYIDVIATDANGERIGMGSSQTFTIDPD